AAARTAGLYGAATGRLAGRRGVVDRAGLGAAPSRMVRGVCRARRPIDRSCDARGPSAGRHPRPGLAPGDRAGREPPDRDRHAACQPRIPTPVTMMDTNQTASRRNVLRLMGVTALGGMLGLPRLAFA